jgi:hypothetical protein
MFKYHIIKRGRKWFEGVTADQKQYKASIEINDISSAWVVDQVVEFEGKFEKKPSGRFFKIYVYPCSTEEKEEEIKIAKFKKEKADIAKWLGYVEDKSSEYVYAKGVDELRALNLSEDEQQRLDAAIKKGTINYCINKIKNHLGYIRTAINEGYWYMNGENTIQKHIQELEKMGQEAFAFKSALKELESQFASYKAEKERTDEERYFSISRLSLGKMDGYNKGQILKSKDGRLGKVIDTYRYYQEDAMSLGYMVDSAWIVSAKCDATIVTVAETEEYLANERKEAQHAMQLEEERKKKKEVNESVRHIINYVFEHGYKPEDIILSEINKNGEIIFDSFNIYGGGEIIIVSDSFIWAIKNNGGDGDNWSRNNVSTGGAGGIGYCMEMDDICSSYMKTIQNNLIDKGDI